MDAMEKLSEHLGQRVSELWKLKKDGKKIVGYSPGGYMPEELVYASGAIPICLVRGGDPEPLTESLAYMPRFQDTFCRSQIGYRMLGEEPLYQMPDILVTPITDMNSRAIADCWNFYTDVEVLRYGIPHNKTGVSFDYYMGGLELIKKKLEGFTGNEITEDKLKAEIESCNKIKGLLNSISLMRKNGPSPISSRDYVKLHHASFYADKETFIGILESLYEELKGMEPRTEQGARILFTGSTLANGDNRIFELLEGTGAEIVYEEFAEGLRPYRHNVDLEGDPIKAMAETYFMKRAQPAWCRPWDETIDNLINLAKEFNVNGVLWYQLMYRDGYDMMSFHFAKVLQEKTGIPMMKLESDYDTSEKGPFKTRLETFAQIM
ncbi:MAG: 2-hydroxyacyl-CoA dehydratase [Deltaproteobacteria bacterium]|nr:2-hydroxyacyl-CoA dehydratase [Deltaproteobacteria bacterium]